MKITAVIAEYNPFHNGHLKLLKKARRETGCDMLAVVMSGSFTQRGDLAVADKYVRADWAIAAGADIVIELPTVYSLSPAKSFAEGALKTLSVLGEYTLCFGTETSEIESLGMVAEFMQSESNDMRSLLKGFLSDGYSVAKSRTLALDKIRPDIANLLQTPNNILAVEYIKAGAVYGDKINFHNVERKPDDGKKIISSTAIRKLLSEGKDASAFVPEFVDLTRTSDPVKYGAIAAYAARTKSPAELAEIANVSEGMENRISKTEFNDLSQLVAAVTSKRYTGSTAKRIAASAAVGLTKELVELARNEKPYCTLLAVRESKRKKVLPLLASSEGYFFFKPSDCPASHPIRPLIDLDERAAKILGICF